MKYLNRAVRLQGKNNCRYRGASSSQSVHSFRRRSSINENAAGSCTWQSARVLLLIDNGDGIASKTHGPVLNYTATPRRLGGPRSAQYGTGQPETLSSQSQR
jgi:hypothetical protein